MLRKKLAIVLLALLLVLPALGGTVMATEEPTTDTAALDLRIALSHLLGEHAHLAIVAMRKGIDGSADFNAASGTLMENAEDLSAAIASVYGEAAGNQFETLWKDHIGFFVDYVTATAGDDEAGKEEALEQLDQYRYDFSGFLANANPNLDSSTLANGLQMHVNQLINAFNKYNEGEYEMAYMQEREAYQHMQKTAALLSGAIVQQFSDTFNNTSTATPAGELRAALGGLLGEHAHLAMTAMQNGVDGAASFEANAGTLMDNADDLTAAIASVYGDEAGTAFETLWKNHIGFFVDYVTATANNDAAAQQTALDNLAQYKQDFSSFLATANPNLEASALANGLQTHVDQLIGTFTDYVDGEYEMAYDKYREAYAHMFMTGDLLSNALVMQFPNNFEVKSEVMIALKIGNPELMINGETIMMDKAPFIENNHTFVSLRFLSEALGATVVWDNDDRSVTVTWDDQTAEYWIDSNTMELNGMAMDVGTDVFIRDGRTQIPLRFFAELMGWQVHWNGETDRVQLMN